MGRYAQYVPVELDYKPYVPNFENWAKVLTQQQQKYDTFEQAFTLANPEHIKQDSGEYKIWQDYMQNTKDEVKNAFLKDAKYGNQKLKNKMFELQKEMQGGLYKGLETRHNEYQAASQQLSEGIKDQPWYNQEYYMDQFKADPMSYTKGEFNHIHPVTVAKDPERNKRLQEYVKSIVPPKISNQVVRLSRKGEPGFGGNAGDWIIDEEVIRKEMPISKFRADLKAFIDSNPDLQEDIRREVYVKDKHLSEEDKALLQSEHKANILNEKERLNLASLLDAQTNDPSEIIQLQARFNLPQTGERTKELEDALAEDIAEKQANLDNVLDLSPKEILYHSIIDQNVKGLYPLIKDQEFSHKQHVAANPYAVQFYNQKFQSQMEQMKEAGRARRHNENIAIQKQAIATENSFGTPVNTQSSAQQKTGFSVYKDIKDNFVTAEADLQSKAAKLKTTNQQFLPNWMSNANTLMNETMKSETNSELYDKVTKLPSNFGNLGQKEQVEKLKEVGLGHLATNYNINVAKDIEEFSNSMQNYESAEQLYNPLKQRLEPIYNEYVKNLSDIVGTNSDYSQTVDEQGHVLTPSEAAEVVGAGGQVFRKTKIHSKERGSYDKYDDLTEDIRKLEVKQFNEDVPVSNAIQSQMFVDNNPKSYFNQTFNGTFKESIISTLNSHLAQDISDPKKTAIFINDKKEKFTLSQVIEKTGGIDLKNTIVHPTTNGRRPGFNITVKDKTGNLYSTEISMNGFGEAFIQNYTQLMASSHATAKQSGNEGNAAYFARQYEGLTDNSAYLPHTLAKDFGRDFNIYNEGSYQGQAKKVKSGVAANGIEFANMLYNGRYYLATKDDKGNYIFVKGRNGIVVSNDRSAIDDKVADVAVRGGQSFLFSGTNKDLNSAGLLNQEETEDEE